MEKIVTFGRRFFIWFVLLILINAYMAYTIIRNRRQTTKRVAESETAVPATAWPIKFKPDRE
jgi:hypothetical protein